MAILNQIPRSERGPGRKYTHRGLLCGICPVYIGDARSQSPALVERNWVPGWWFDLTQGLFAIYAALQEAVDPAFEPEFPIVITGKIDQ